MSTGFEYRGDWWLPDDPEKRIAGTLKFDPDEGAVLDLMGTFHSIGDSKSTNVEDMLSDCEIILGISSNGKKITLYKCFGKKLQAHLPNLVTTISFFISSFFIGVHFRGKEEIKFKKVYVHYSNSNEWSTGISGLKIYFPAQKSGVTIIEHKNPEPVPMFLNDELKIFISMQPTSSHKIKEVYIKERAFVSIEFPEQESLEKYLDIVYHIRNFLSLAVTVPVFPLVMEGKTEINKWIRENETIYPSVEIYLRSVVPKVLKPPTRSEMLFTLKEVRDKIGDLIGHWFDKRNFLEPVYNLYFGTLYNPDMYLSSRFLSLVQAIEAYHRRSTNNCELPKDEHEKRIQEILDAVPHCYKCWLNKKLNYSNEPTLRRRLKNILIEFSDTMRTIIGNSKNRESFVNKIANTRNYLTHYDKDLEQKAANGKELYRLTQKLMLLIEACLLKELGFTPDEIKNFISKKTRHRLDLR